MTDSTPATPTPEPGPSISPPAKKKFSFLLLGILAAILLIFAAAAHYYYYQGPCGVNKLQKASDQIMSISTRWDDANTLANSTPRINLSGPIANLQSIRRDRNDLPVPTCMEKARSYIADSMDFTITGYLSFAAQDTDSAVNSASRASESVFHFSPTKW